MDEYWDINTNEELSDYELDQRYTEFLDMSESEVELFGSKYSPSLALRWLDPITYRVVFNDWLDSEIGESITDEEPTDD